MFSPRFVGAVLATVLVTLPVASFAALYIDGKDGFKIYIAKSKCHQDSATNAHCEDYERPGSVYLVDANNHDCVVGNIKGYFYKPGQWRWDADVMSGRAKCHGEWQNNNTLWIRKN